jgi:hypothetical protein
MTYTINGKEWTEFDINKRCADIMNLIYRIYGDGTVHKGIFDLSADKYFCPCNSPSDTDAIIDKCWDELIFADYRRNVTWEMLMEKHECTKLVAACICYIEINEPAL